MLLFIFNYYLLIITVLMHIILTINIRVKANAADVLSSIKTTYRSRGFPFREDEQFPNTPILPEYDFIVVGAGPAGCVVANRLTENTNWTVLLLEAGKDESLINEITPIAHYLQFTDYNYGYLTDRQPGACLGLVNSQCPWPSGRGTGGGSLINNNIYTRGNMRDYDEWYEDGNDGWSYLQVLPYFLKSEDIGIGNLKRSPYHGVGGLLPVEYPPFRSQLLETFLLSAKEVGLNLVDYNNPATHVGFSHIQGTIRYGRKVSAYRAFIRPFKERKNLHVAINSKVTKILIDPVKKEAVGVEFVKNKRRRNVFARKEVILSAGTFNSPQLLMLSGIGPKEHLQQFNIPVLQDLRVGDNLQEHPAFANLAFTVNKKIGLITERLLRDSLSNIFGWLEGEGWLTTLGCEGLGYVNTIYNNLSSSIINNRPDIEFIFVPTSLAGEAGIGGSLLRKSMGIPDSTYNDVYRDIMNKDSWSIWPMLMYPESRGTVRLRSANPWHAPAIQSNFFDSPIDLYRIVEGIKLVIRLSETEAFQKIGSTLNKRPIPGCKDLPFASDEYWMCAVRQLTMQMHHQSGTCKMGPSTDQSAVVNQRLKVYGIGKLRVIDASIIPKIPGAHTVAAAYMIGEKGADLVKEEWYSSIPI